MILKEIEAKIDVTGPIERNTTLADHLPTQ
jgi:hypothetical protein